MVVASRGIYVVGGCWGSRLAVSGGARAQPGNNDFNGVSKCRKWGSDYSTMSTPFIPTW